MSYQIKLKRYPSEKVQTRGNFTLFVNGTEVYKGVTLELPWLNNQHQISCIPVGAYPLVNWQSAKFGFCLRVCDVPNRDAILCHAGNYHENTHGCVLFGDKFTDLDKDGYLDITNSRLTINNILALIEGDGVLIIE